MFKIKLETKQKIDIDLTYFGSFLEQNTWKYLPRFSQSSWNIISIAIEKTTTTTNRTTTTSTITPTIAQQEQPQKLWGKKPHWLRWMMQQLRCLGDTGVLSFEIWSEIWSREIRSDAKASCRRYREFSMDAVQERTLGIYLRKMVRQTQDSLRS